MPNATTGHVHQGIPFPPPGEPQAATVTAMTLTADQCSLIAQVIPVLLLTLMAERKWRFSRPPPVFALRLYAVVVTGLALFGELLALEGADGGLDGGDGATVRLAAMLTGATVFVEFTASVFFGED